MGAITAIKLLVDIFSYASMIYMVFFLFDFEDDQSPKFLSFIPNINANSNLSFNKNLSTEIFTVTVFCFHHSIFIREPVRKFLTNNFNINDKLQRIFYSLFATILLIFVVITWNSSSNPIGGGYIWNIELLSSQNNFLIRNILTLLSILFQSFVLYQIEKLKIIRSKTVRTEGIYGVIRHPAQLATLMILWLTPKMTVSRFIFDVLMTMYIFIGLYFEEKTLINKFGTGYIEYKTKVPALLPFL